MYRGGTLGASGDSLARAVGQSHGQAFPLAANRSESSVVRMSGAIRS